MSSAKVASANPYGAVVGVFLWIENGTRRGIVIAVTQVARYCTDPRMLFGRRVNVFYVIYLVYRIMVSYTGALQSSK